MQVHPVYEAQDSSTTMLHLTILVMSRRRKNRSLQARLYTTPLLWLECTRVSIPQNHSDNSITMHCSGRGVPTDLVIPGYRIWIRCLARISKMLAHYFTTCISGLIPRPKWVVPYDATAPFPAETK